MIVNLPKQRVRNRTFDSNQHRLTAERLLTLDDDTVIAARPTEPLTWELSWFFDQDLDEHSLKSSMAPNRNLFLQRQ